MGEIFVVAGIVLNPAQKLLLVRKKNTYLLPGGKPEPQDHTLKQTLQRELLEEANLELTSAEFFGEYRYNKTAIEPIPLRMRVYVTTWKGTLKACGNIEELLWIDDYAYQQDYQKHPHAPTMPRAHFNPLFYDLNKKRIFRYDGPAR